MGPTAGAERHYNFHFWSTHGRLSKNKNPLSQKLKIISPCAASLQAESARPNGMVRYSHEMQGIRPQVGFQLVRLYRETPKNVVKRKPRGKKPAGGWVWDLAKMCGRARRFFLGAAPRPSRVSKDQGPRRWRCVCSCADDALNQHIQRSLADFRPPPPSAVPTKVLLSRGGVVAFIALVVAYQPPISEHEGRGGMPCLVVVRCASCNNLQRTPPASSHTGTADRT
jgi:hypothetical protein